MKIVYLSGAALPSRTANSIHVMKMCQAFVRNGHEVVLVAPNYRDALEPGVDDVYEFYGVDKCFEIIKLPWLPIKGRGYIYGLLAALQARGHKPDIVYCRNTPACFFAAKIDLPVIFESHAPLEDSGKISEWMFNRLVLSHRLKKLVVITHALKEYYLTNNPRIKCPIQVAPDGADPVPEGIEPVDLPNKGKRLQVGYVGHLYKGKGMEVISKLAPLCPWADFNVVGGKKQDLQKWKGLCTGIENIVFHGYVPHSESMRYIKAFDITLIPNQNHVSTHGSGNRNISKWTSPLKIFEYMAADKPIISSDLPVLREVLRHEQSALLCPPDDALEWKKALERLRDDPQLAERLANAAQDEFLKKYTWQARAGNVLD
jgi:glycosyltransferase involved in cell wall biosynthesis